MFKFLKKINSVLLYLSENLFLFIKVISTNDAENQKLNISIPIIPQKILKANQLGSATKHLIIFIEENYPMQWVQPENMFEMFINKDVDKNFLGNFVLFCEG